MQPIKKQIIDIIKHMPDDSTVDDIFEKLYFKAQVDKGINELNEGKSISHHKVKENVSKWVSE